MSSRCSRRKSWRKLIAEIAKPGDYVVCMGAGTITNWANLLPSQLQALSEGKS